MWTKRWVSRQKNQHLLTESRNLIFRLILHLQHTITLGEKLQSIRFTHASFDNSGHVLSAADHSGRIFLVDIAQNKFWALPRVNSCTVLQFSHYNSREVFVGVTSGKLYIIHVDTGEITGQLAYHQRPVQEITFSDSFLCLTSSPAEGIIWDLRTNTKVQVLNIEPNCLLKHVGK